MGLSCSTFRLLQMVFWGHLGASHHAQPGSVGAPGAQLQLRGAFGSTSRDLASASRSSRSSRAATLRGWRLMAPSHPCKCPATTTSTATWTQEPDSSHVPGGGVGWAKAPGWQRDLGAWGGRWSGSQDAQHSCTLSCIPHRALTLTQAPMRTRGFTPAHLLYQGSNSLPASPNPHRGHSFWAPGSAKPHLCMPTR